MIYQYINQYKRGFKNIFMKKNYLKLKVINLFLIIDVIAFKTIVLRAFSYKISCKLKKFKTNFEDKLSFIMKMSKSKLINSSPEDENNTTEESETSDDEYLSDFTKLQPYLYERCVSKESVKENCPGKELSDLQEDTIRLEVLSGVLVVDTNQWLLIQKAFAARINMRL